MSHAIATIEPIKIVERSAQQDDVVVEQGYQPLLEREVVVWRLTSWAAGDPRVRGRFVRDARTLAGLRHHNIVRVYEASEANHLPYAVMEQLSGITVQQRLEQFINRRERMDRRTVLTILRGVAEALEYAHRRGVFGFDLSTTSIVLTDDGGTVLTGLAQPLPDNQLDLSAAALNYVAPERLTGGVVDGRSDVYALGVLMYALLVGRLPFEGSAGGILARKEVCNSLPALEDPRAEPSAPVDLLPVMRRATARQLDLRYPSVAALAEALAEAAGEGGADRAQGQISGGRRAAAQLARHRLSRREARRGAAGAQVTAEEDVLVERSVGEGYAPLRAIEPAQAIDLSSLDPLLPGRDDPALWAALPYTTLVPLEDEADAPDEAQSEPAAAVLPAPSTNIWLLFLLVAGAVAMGAAITFG